MRRHPEHPYSSIGGSVTGAAYTFTPVTPRRRMRTRLADTIYNWLVYANRAIGSALQWAILVLFITNFMIDGFEIASIQLGVLWLVFVKLREQLRERASN